MIYSVLLTIPIISLIIGWLYGRNLINPDTPEGRTYYNN